MIIIIYNPEEFFDCGIVAWIKFFDGDIICKPVKGSFLLKEENDDICEQEILIGQYWENSFEYCKNKENKCTIFCFDQTDFDGKLTGFRNGKIIDFADEILSDYIICSPDVYSCLKKIYHQILCKISNKDIDFQKYFLQNFKNENHVENFLNIFSTKNDNFINE